MPVKTQSKPSGCASLPAGGERARCRAKQRARQARELQVRWLTRLAFGPTPQQDQLIQLWLGIFPVHWRQLPTAGLLWRQIATIRSRLDSGYGDLLHTMVLDPALQISLNGSANRRGNPNENLARELLELFSLGEGHCSETDVKEAARALTGYRQRKGRMQLVPKRHDHGPKTILGRRELFNATSLVALLCSHPATAITTRLWPRLVGAPANAARIEAIARDWRRHGLSLPWLVTSLSQTPEARAARREGSQLQDPIPMLARSLRLLGSRHPDAFNIAMVHLRRMGQAPFEPPSVKGWPVNEEWLRLRWLLARRRGLAALLADEEVWESRRPPERLEPDLTPIPPLTLSLPATASRANLARLFADPVWQLR